jgi:hypothetical protein
MKKPVFEWECHSIYSAFENYVWAFKHSDPVKNISIKGKTFNDSFESLQLLSSGLRKSIENGDNEACKKYCYSILEWGGVLSKNDQRITRLGNDICRYLNSTRDIFTSDLALTDYYNEDIIMNSGFTKIYSLYIDDFVIYDGRVGAALGLLVRMFCEDSKLKAVPAELAFAWGKGKESIYQNSCENRRNPSKESYRFPELLNNSKRHIENNIRANWLLREIIDETESKFSNLDKSIQMRALEAALFMIGYDVAS